MVVLATGSLYDERVAQVMMQVDRGNYCDDAPYTDGPAPIGFGATISAPHMVSHDILQYRVVVIFTSTNLKHPY